MEEQREFYQKRWFKMTVAVVAILVIGVFSFMRVKHISPISVGIYDEINQSIFSDLAIEGYDPVAYFELGQAVEGNPEYSFVWNGATWQFSTEENLELFRKHPENYAPSYGGYCSFAVSKGFTANIDPQAWMIEDGKLYLFAEPKFQKQFKEQLSELKPKADKNWQKTTY